MASSELITGRLSRRTMPPHARLTVQRKIVSTLRAMWLTMTPDGDEVMP